MAEPLKIDFSKMNLVRTAHNFLMNQKKGEYSLQEIDTLNSYLQSILLSPQKELPTYKVAVMMVCINENYWRYLKPVLSDLKTLFLPGHKVDVLLWSDIRGFSQKKKEYLELLTKSQKEEDIVQTFLKICVVADSLQVQKLHEILKELEVSGISVRHDNTRWWLELQKQEAGHFPLIAEKAKKLLKEDFMQGIDATIFDTEPVEWPLPTLMRYNLFLSEEETLKKYDYIFYLDVDMRIVNVVGDEILGNGLTMAKHPMYALRQNLIPPYEPNPESAAHFKQFGRLLVEAGKPRFEPLYAAGGFQGGKTQDFIDAMKTMKKGTDKDFQHNYMARWNDESHWNRYLFDHTPSVVLSPSYIYPDSLIEEYYKPIWGRDYTPRIITLTKPFTTSKEGGQAVAQTIQDLKKL